TRRWADAAVAGGEASFGASVKTWAQLGQRVLVPRARSGTWLSRPQNAQAARNGMAGPPTFASIFGDRLAVTAVGQQSEHGRVDGVDQGTNAAVAEHELAQPRVGAAELPAVIGPCGDRQRVQRPGAA